MTKTLDKEKIEIPLEGMILNCGKDKYKLAYAAIRWAKEIKQKENLPEVVQLLVPRALREILTGKVSIKDVEKLPVISRAPQPVVVPSVPTITLNLQPEDKPEKESK